MCIIVPAEMISLKVLHHVSFPASKLLFIHDSRPRHSRKNLIISLCSPDNGGGSERSSPEGDTRKQELLARIAMLQTQKVRMTDYLNERADYLTKFAEQANAEIDKVGEEALKELDEASSRIMDNIENQMQAFEESAQEYRMDIEKSDQKLADFEEQMEKDRNIGMFFTTAPKGKPKAKEEAKKIKDLTDAEAGSKVRMNIYLALIGLLGMVIVNGVISTSPDWRKFAVFGAILIGLIAQYLYEKKLSLDIKETEKQICEKEKL